MAGREISHIGHITFDEKTVEQFDYLARNVRRGLADISEPEFFDEIDSLAEDAKDLAPRQAAQLQTVAAHQGARALIVDFPSSTVAAVGATPSHHPEAGKQRLLSSDIYRALVVSMAGLYSYGNRRIQNGAIHSDIIFTTSSEDSSAKDAEMRLHVDGLYANRNQQQYSQPGEPNRNVSPDWLSFHFQRNNEKIPTVVVFPQWDELSEETVAILQQPILNLGKGLPPVSVLYGDPKDPWIRYVTDEEYIDTASSKAERQALQELNTHLFSKRVPLLMKAGQILFINNRKVLHGREERQTNTLPQTKWRWQRRVSHSTDASRIQSEEVSSRVVDSQTIYKVV